MRSARSTGGPSSNRSTRPSGRSGGSNDDVITFDFGIFARHLEWRLELRNVTTRRCAGKSSDDDRRRAGAPQRARRRRRRAARRHDVVDDEHSARGPTQGNQRGTATAFGSGAGALGGASSSTQEPPARHPKLRGHGPGDHLSRVDAAASPVAGRRRDPRDDVDRFGHEVGQPRRRPGEVPALATKLQGGDELTSPAGVGGERMAGVDARRRRERRSRRKGGSAPLARRRAGSTAHGAAGGQEEIAESHTRGSTQGV